MVARDLHKNRRRRRASEMYGGSRRGILCKEDRGRGGGGGRGRDNDDEADTDGTDDACVGNLPLPGGFNNQQLSKGGRRQRKVVGWAQTGVR